MAINKSNKEKINDALVFVSRKNNSYTGETLVEGLTKGRELKLLNDQLKLYTSHLEKLNNSKDEPSKMTYTRMINCTQTRINVLTT